MIDAAQLGPLIRDAVRDEIRDALRDAGARTTTHAPLVRKNEIAHLLGVSQPTIDRLSREGMPFERVGVGRRFNVEQCRAWLSARSAKPTTQASSTQSSNADDDAATLLARGGVRVSGAR